MNGELIVVDDVPGEFGERVIEAFHARPGEGLLFVGRSHTAFEAVVAEREYAALTTRPADLADLATPMRSAPPDTG